MSYLPAYIAYGVVVVIFIGLAWLEFKQITIKWYIPTDKPKYKCYLDRRNRD